MPTFNVESLSHTAGSDNVFKVQYTFASAFAPFFDATAIANNHELWIEFPYDATTVNNGFLHDLGLGLANGSEIDCPTAPENSFAATVEIRCYLSYSKSAPTIRVRIYGNAAADDKLSIWLAGIKNPVSANIDIKITGKLVKLLSIGSNYKVDVLLQFTDDYIDTTYTTGSVSTTTVNPCANCDYPTVSSRYAGSTGFDLELDLKNTYILQHDAANKILDYVLVTLDSRASVGAATPTCATSPDGTAFTNGTCWNFPKQRKVLILPADAQSLAQATATN